MIEQAGAGVHCSIDQSRVALAAFDTITYGLYVVTARDLTDNEARTFREKGR